MKRYALAAVLVLGGMTGSVLAQGAGLIGPKNPFHNG